MIKEVHDNVWGSSHPKITNLAEKIADLTFSINEDFKELKKINDELKASAKVHG
jgi:hypothetical protein